MTTESPIDSTARSIAAGIKPGDLFGLSHEGDYTYEVCQSLEEAIAVAPEYICDRIDVLRDTGMNNLGVPIWSMVYTLTLETARTVSRAMDDGDLGE